MQLDLLVTREMTGRDVQRELFRAILVEMMYRDRGNIAAGTPYVTAPDWLVEGILALQPGRDSDSDAELLRRIVASKKIARLKTSLGKGGRSSTRHRDSCTRPTPRRSCNCCSRPPGGSRSSRDLSGICRMRLTTRWPICVRIFRKRWGVLRINGGP